MGTSTSQASRSSTTWATVRASYTSDAVPIGQVVTQVWRAAQIDAEVSWRELLTSPILTTCLELAVRNNSAVEASRAAARAIALGSSASLAAEVAQRAIIQSFSSDSRAQAYTEAVFAEATNYLVSRDLSGLVGELSRCRTVVDSVAFKDAVRRSVEQIVQARGVPLDDLRDSWSSYVDSVLGDLAGRRG